MPESKRAASTRDDNPYTIPEHIFEDTQHTVKFVLDYMTNLQDKSHDNDIDAILSSAEWRLVTRFIRLRKQFIPSGSKRGRLYHGFKKMLISWIQPTTKRDSTGLVNGFIRPRARNSLYQKHIQWTEPTIGQLLEQGRIASTWDNQPSFSIVTPVYNTELWMLDDLTNSIRTQTYTRWQWIIVDASDDDTSWLHLNEITSDLDNVHILRTANRGISANTNKGLLEATGDFIVAIDHDDMIAPDALFEIAKCINRYPDADLIYSDMDKLDQDGWRVRPFFKPAWSPETMLCANIVTHLTCYRRKLLDSVGLLDSEMDVAQDWDLYLRISEVTNNIYHIPRVLYHWRMSASSTAGNNTNKKSQDPQRLAIQQHLQRLNLQNPKVEFDDHDAVRASHPIVSWSLTHEHLVSIIIPIRFEHEREAVSSLISNIKLKTTYGNYEIIVVDTHATSPNDNLKTSEINYIHQPHADTISLYRIYQIGYRQAQGHYTVFLDADAHIRTMRWLTRLIQWFEKDKMIAGVSPKIVQSDNTIIHAGIVVAVQPVFPFAGSKNKTFSMAGASDWYRNWSALAPGAFVLRHSAVEQVGMFDENEAHDDAILDLCLRLSEMGHRFVYTPDVTLELSIDRTSNEHLIADMNTYLHRLQHVLPNGDPHDNPNLWFFDGQPIYSFGLNANTINRLLHSSLFLTAGDRSIHSNHT